MFNTFIVQPIFNLLIFIYSLVPGGDFGIAIIIFTVIVRMALWPLVKKQLHQTKAMRKMQPELVKIKKEAKGNKQLESMMMLELYKKYDVNPFRSIGVLIIQLPIFMALYQVIRTLAFSRDKVEGLTYDFLKGLGPIKEIIANPNHFNAKLFGFIDLTKSALADNSVNIILLLLVIAAAGTQYVMSKQIAPKSNTKKKMREILSEAASGKEADQSEMSAAMMGSMTKFLPIMMLFIMIGLPGAIVLYYMVSNLIAIAQQHYVLKDDAEDMVEIADKAYDKQNKQNKNLSAKTRAKEAKEANIIHIKAKDNSFKNSKSTKKRKGNL
ncbi:MAG: YidC/Oxa1 family membrane protein insertase [Candidatus Saccharimonadales bacterium]